MTVEVLKVHAYPFGTANHPVGAQYDAPLSDVRVLEAAGLVRVVPLAPPKTSKKK